jgi:hypothetical protein
MPARHDPQDLVTLTYRKLVEVSRDAFVEGELSMASHRCPARRSVFALCSILVEFPRESKMTYERCFGIDAFSVNDSRPFDSFRPF